MDENTIKGLEVGSRLHDEWRRPRKLEDGKYEPRWKVTNDVTYELVPGKGRISDDGSMEVDIASLSFEELPRDWQEENLQAGLAVVPIVGKKEELSDAEMEECAKKVHDEWCSREERIITAYMNKLEQQGIDENEILKKKDEKFGWDISLMVSYDELSEEEKQKDRDQVIQALKLNKEISKGSIKIEDLSKKYEKQINELKEIS